MISDPVYTPDDRRLTIVASGAATFRGAEASADRLARLPYSAIEARAVVRAFAGMDVIELAGFNATARRVIELPSEDLGVLHFATHAVARRDAPEQSALFLSEFAADGTPLAQDRLTADDIARSGLRADVVVSSGCATGDGRELRGEGVLGLTYWLPRQWLEHRGRVAVAGGGRADGAIHGGVLRRLPGHRPYRRRIAHRAVAHARHGRRGGVVELRRPGEWPALGHP